MRGTLQSTGKRKKFYALIVYLHDIVLAMLCWCRSPLPVENVQKV